MTDLTRLMAAVGMTREQIRRAVATAYGRFNPDTYARVRDESDARLYNLFTAMRGTRDMILEEGIYSEADAAELRGLIKKHSPVDSGKLKESWSDPETVQFTSEGNVVIDNPLPYARIQDLGGTIHRISSRGKPFTIRIEGHHYVQKAINEFNEKPEHALEPARATVSGGVYSLGGLLQYAMTTLKQQGAI